MRKIEIYLNLFIGFMTFFAWIYMGVFGENNTLEARSLSSLKFYTVLSNLFNGSILIICGMMMIMGNEYSETLKALRLCGTAVVGITFFTVVIFLGPLYGYANMYKNSNLWLHLILPILSFVSLLVFARGESLPFTATLYSVVFTLLYEIGYVVNILIRGIGSGESSNDFYGFLNWGILGGAVIAVVMLLASWGMSVAFYYLSGSGT